MLYAFFVANILFSENFPQCGNIFSIVWKNRETFFHCVEKSGPFFHGVENIFPHCGKVMGGG